MEQLIHDNSSLFGSIWKMCWKGIVTHHILAFMDSEDGMSLYITLVKEFGPSGNKVIEAIKWEAVLDKCYSSSYPGGLEGYANDKLTAYTQLAIIGHSYDDEPCKQKLLQNLVIPSVTNSLYGFLTHSNYSFTRCISYLGDNSRLTNIMAQKHSKHKANHAFTKDQGNADHPDAFSSDQVIELMALVGHAKGPNDYKIPSGAWGLMKNDPEWQCKFIKC